MKKSEILIEIKKILTDKNLIVSVAESCTGGLISSYLTDIDGASKFVCQNFVTYSNDAKHKFLDVKNDTLNLFGAVSEQTAQEMAKGLLQYGDISIATTGILGPTGGSKEKPIGLVYIAFAYRDNVKVIRYISKKADTNNRLKIKKDIAKYTLFEFLNYLKNTLY